MGKEECIETLHLDHMATKSVSFTPAAGVTINSNMTKAFGDLVNICIDLSMTGTFTFGTSYPLGTISKCYHPYCDSTLTAIRMTPTLATGIVTFHTDGTVTINLLTFDGSPSVNPTVHLSGLFLRKSKCNK
jgi:hypothetical protein